MNILKIIITMDFEILVTYKSINAINYNKKMSLL
jgi:hypothetical protein